MDIIKIIREGVNNYLIKEEIKFDNFILDDKDISEIMKGYFDTAIWTEEERLGQDRGELNKDDEYEEGFYDESGESEEEIRFMKIMRSKLESKPMESFTSEYIDEDSKISAYLDVKNFILMSGEAAIREAIEENGFFRLGMDIWLSRNGHGSGFFDHSYDNEEILENSAQKIGSSDLYLGDDQKLHLT